MHGLTHVVHWWPVKLGPSLVQEAIQRDQPTPENRHATTAMLLDQSRLKSERGPFGSRVAPAEDPYDQYLHLPADTRVLLILSLVHSTGV